MEIASLAKMLNRNMRRWLAEAAGVLSVAVICNHAERQARFSGPDHGFQSCTGIALPTGVSAMAHSTDMNDNLFHETHYWRLSGPDSSLRSLADSFGLERSDEDAKWMMPDLQMMFGLSVKHADIIEGYEGNSGGGRDRWLVIFSHEQGAVFVF